jgi:hypothetical protein
VPSCAGPEDEHRLTSVHPGGFWAWLQMAGPPQAARSSFDVEAIVWRVNRDGLAFFSAEDHRRRLTHLLAKIAGLLRRCGRPR